MSGTYKCENKMAFQAGLPIDLLWVLVVNESEDDTTCADPASWIRLENNMVLKKAISGTDQDLIKLQREWVATIHAVADMNPSYKECYKKLSRMVESRKAAVDEYGYLSTCKPFMHAEGYSSST